MAVVVRRACLVALGAHRSASFGHYVINGDTQAAPTCPSTLVVIVMKDGIIMSSNIARRRSKQRAHLRTHSAASTGERLRRGGRRPTRATEQYLVSVLNEIHHQQNSIQINKILQEHGIKHKIKH